MLFESSILHGIVQIITVNIIYYFNIITLTGLRNKTIG